MFTKIIILSLIISSNIYASSINDYVNINLNVKTSCDDFVNLWEVTQDSVSNDELYLSFSKASAICNNDNFTLRVLTVEKIAAKELSLNYLVNDFDLRLFQIVRKYGNFTEKYESSYGTELKYEIDYADIIFRIVSGKVFSISLDFKRVLNNSVQRSAQFELEKIQSLTNIINIWNQSGDHHISSRSGLIAGSNNCHVQLNESGSSDEESYKSNHIISFKEASFSVNFENIYFTKGIRYWENGVQQSGDSHQLFFKDKASTQEFRKALLVMDKYCH